VTKHDDTRRSTLGRAVVTGGAGDIGRAIGVALASGGYEVMLTDLLDEARGTDVAAAATAAAGATVDYARLDVTDPDATAALLDQLDQLTLFVANAGTVVAAPFLDITPEQWQRQLEVNLTGAFFGAQAAARVMVRRKTRGLLLFTSSWVAQRPWPEITAYATSKAGLEQLVRQIALELAPHGVRANAVAPGIVRAGLAKHQLDTEPAYAARAGTASPLGELQTAEEIADAVAFLASPAAATMDGAVLLVDTGCSLGTMR
jgi:NAD(P)-dependent dehydrogenase (short-subunit alcohol dehydrogenase family)